MLKYALSKFRYIVHIAWLRTYIESVKRGLFYSVGDTVAHHDRFEVQYVLQ